MPQKFVKGRLNFSCKSTTAANVDLTESLLDNWLKNNHITVNKIYHLRSLFVFFTNFSFQIYFSTAENQHKNRILLQLAKIRLEWISQSNGNIDRPLGFVIDRLNTSASLYRIAPYLSLSFSLWDKHRSLYILPLLLQFFELPFFSFLFSTRFSQCLSLQTNTVLGPGPYTTTLLVLVSDREEKPLKQYGVP